MRLVALVLGAALAAACGGSQKGSASTSTAADANTYPLTDELAQNLDARAARARADLPCPEPEKLSWRVMKAPYIAGRATGADVARLEVSGCGKSAVYDRRAK